MTTYPPAPLAYQNKLALDNTRSQIAYVGHEGTIFHLSGPFAPVPGAQSGVVLSSGLSGLMAPFKHLDNKGARQDGKTWYDTLYDEAEIDMMIELSGMSAADMRKTVASWLGAWDPKKQGKLCWFSPERGEWYANVRLNKNIPDQIKSDWYSGKLNLTWSMRNDDAFWRGVDSVCTFNIQDNAFVDRFPETHPASLGDAWTQANTGPGVVAQPSGTGASWVTSGTTTGTAICQVTHSRSTFDDQFVSVTLGQDMPAPVGGANAYVDIWGRLNTDAGATGAYGVRARIGYGTAQLSIFNNGVQHDVWSGSIDGNGVTADQFTLQCGVVSPLQQNLEQFFTGTNWTPNQYQIYQNGQPLIPGGIIGAIENFFGLDFGYIDTNHYANVGAGYRGFGFGMSAGGTGTGQVVPPTISAFNGGVGTGHMTLTNIGDQPAWPRYLCYGPGTFLIGDGPDASNMISFGPLLEGQVALITTMPRLPTVVDLSPPPTPAQLDLFGQIEQDVRNFIKNLIDFATNNNVPPLLQQFESLFGILPPQGSLYSLLSGRFTQPLPAMLEQEGPVTKFIPCQIQGGNSNSKIVAAVTPFRRWPE